MDHTKEVDKIEKDVNAAIHDLELADALEFVEELTARLEGIEGGLRDDIEALESGNGDVDDGA